MDKSKEYCDMENITFRLFSEYTELKHAYSTREGGVSEGCFSSLNLGFFRGDEEERVLENYRRFAQTLGLELDQLVLSNQVHGAEIYHIKKHDAGKGFTKRNDIIGVDGFITKELGLGLVTLYADCVPLFFYDPKQKVIGLAHAGWKGSALKIAKKMIDEMVSYYGCNPKDVLVGIGPSIGPCCYEVSEDVKKEFDFLAGSVIMTKIVSKIANGKYKLNLWQINKEILLQAGVLEKHIEISALCTKCDSNRFFSHREMGVNRGSQAAIIALEGGIE
ncbi:MAG: peptidoglycan editing factor PgeF [Vallitaleaceae bacterium]|nr:peptidoglycan editing factor PgeF [Vallitaleaceae bacterium]